MTGFSAKPAFNINFIFFEKKNFPPGPQKRILRNREFFSALLSEFSFVFLQNSGGFGKGEWRANYIFSLKTFALVFKFSYLDLKGVGVGVSPVKKALTSFTFFSLFFSYLFL